MQDKALYLLAQFDGETQNILANYNNILCQNGFIGNQTKDIPYHFTLGSSDVDCEEHLEDMLKKVCSNTKCIDLGLSYIGLFGQNVLFVAPSMNLELLNLQQSFFTDSGRGCHKWVAHATLLIDEPETILKAIPIITENFKPFKARIESVGLYEFFPTRFIKECKLNLN